MFRRKDIAREARWWMVHSIGLALVCALTSAGYIFGVAPVINMENERLALGKLLEAAKQREQMLASNQAQVANQLEASTLEVGRASIELHTIEFQNQRLAEIAQIAEANNVRINKMVPGSLVEGEKHDVAPIELEAHGTYAAFSRFVGSIHSAFPDVGIETFAMQSLAKSTDGDAAISLTMVWHVAHTIQP